MSWTQDSYCNWTSPEYPDAVVSPFDLGPDMPIWLATVGRQQIGIWPTPEGAFAGVEQQHAELAGLAAWDGYMRANDPPEPMPAVVSCNVWQRIRRWFR